MNTFCPKQSDLINSFYNAASTGEDMSAPEAAFEAYTKETAETLPYIQSAKALPEDVITYLNESDPDVEILSEKDFL